MYDIFFLSTTTNLDEFNRLKTIYPRIQLVNTPVSFTELKNKSFTKMFWVIHDDLILSNEFNLNNYRATKWDNTYTHIFKNGEHYDGVCLFPKSALISQREFDNRFFIEKKEIDIVASNPAPYKIYTPSTYEEYKNITDDMFWIVWPEIEIVDNTIFDFYVSHHNIYDRNENHVFLHQFKENELTYNGLMLMSKHKTVSKREFDFRYLIQKKEHEVVASKHRLYDVVFISYNEPTADENFKNLKTRFPRAKRVHGVKGIHNAHIRAAELAETEMFWVVDGDAIITDNFNFDHVVSRYDLTTVQVWRSQNPINDLVYGYGGVKLLPRLLTLNMNINSTDMTTSISDLFRVQLDVSNITAFNTDPFNTWKSAFRECVKLSSQSIVRQDSDETISRLDTWCSLGADRPFGEYAIKGANEGRVFGTKYKDDSNMLSKINDFDWLKQHYGI